MSTNQWNGQPYPSISGGAQEITAQTAPPASAPVWPQPMSTKRGGGRRGWLIALIAFVVVAVIAGGVLWYFTGRGNSTRAVVGQASFISSGLVSPLSNQGITDQVQVNLQNLQDPAPGKSYYAWLLADTDQNMEISPIALGTLAVKNGKASLAYQGDAQNDNLLVNYSRLLITEEDSGAAPNSPSLQPSTWRYYAAFSRVANPQDTLNHFSLLAHLRHLLAQDPKLGAVGLVGGLDTWLFRNTLKIVEWSGSTRDSYITHDTGLMRRQLTRILDYLDGSQYVQTENLPADLQPVINDATLAKTARVALLPINPDESPPAYLTHISNHLRELIQSPGASSEQQQTAIAINQDMNNIHSWLTSVHTDAEQLVHMTPEQLQQPAALDLLNDLFVQADYAFIGQIDPNTHVVKGGVSQVHNAAQSLATFKVTTCDTQNASNPCI